MPAEAERKTLRCLSALVLSAPAMLHVGGTNGRCQASLLACWSESRRNVDKECLSPSACACFGFPLRNTSGAQQPDAQKSSGCTVESKTLDTGDRGHLVWHQHVWCETGGPTLGARVEPSRAWTVNGEQAPSEPSRAESGQKATRLLGGVTHRSRGWNHFWLDWAALPEPCIEVVGSFRFAWIGP